MIFFLVYKDWCPKHPFFSSVLTDIYLCSLHAYKQTLTYTPSKYNHTFSPSSHLIPSLPQTNMAALPPPLSLNFTVSRKLPELVLPAKPTPRKKKQLSDIDDQQGLRFHVPMIMFYQNNLTRKGIDPVRVIREALARALVYYYPFAGMVPLHSKNRFYKNIL